MILFPAIDIKNGKCVRLEQGDFSKMKVFGEDPVAMARHWCNEGGQYLHIVDLDGAKTGEAVNKEIIKDIVKSVSVPVQCGGGIRNLAYGEELLEAGVSRIILGTGALEDQVFTRDILKRHGEKIAVSMDAKDGFLAVRGWTEVSEVKAADFARELEDLGLKTLVYTDIAKDGMLAGPNFAELAVMQAACGCQIIASGGVTTPADVQKLRKMDLYGAIIGKALYAGSIRLSEVL